MSNIFDKRVNRRFPWINIVNYNDLKNKPQIGNVPITGIRPPEFYGLQRKLTAGENVTLTQNSDGTQTISMTGIDLFYVVPQLPAEGEAKDEEMLINGISIYLKSSKISLSPSGVLIGSILAVYVPKFIYVFSTKKKQHEDEMQAIQAQNELLREQNEMLKNGTPKD